MEMLAKRATMPLDEAIEAALPWTYAPDTPRELIDEDIALRLEIRTTGEGYSNQLTGGLGYPGTGARLPGLDVPTLVMTGDADKLVPPANSDILAKLIPGARKEIIPGGSHVFFTERAAEASAPILGFLADVDQEVSHARS
jgi:pimeloyl-ACP methyl ester carboxylesterase